MHQWGTLNSSVSGLMRGFSESISQMELRHPGLLPDIRKGATVFIGSDYGGQHASAKYETYTFILADFENCINWENFRRNWRRLFLTDGRRMSYKNLNDKRCRKALLPFLYAANSIPGIVVTVLVDKRIRTLFEPLEYPEKEKSPIDYRNWKEPVFEKLLRITHFASLFLAGLSRPSQNVIWITDEDEIVPNDARMRDATNLFAIISSHYLNHTLGHFRWGTTKIDSKERQLEDLVSIADLVAGSLSFVFTKYSEADTVPKSDLIVPPPQNVPRKTKDIMDWFADNTQILKRIVYAIEPLEGRIGFNLKHLRFHGSRDVFF